MKHLLLIIMLFAVCPSVRSQPINDSIELKQNLKKLDKKMSEIKLLNEKLEKKEKSFYQRVMYFISELSFKHKADNESKPSKYQNKESIKPESEAVFCEDSCTEVVERSFLGKLFNKSKYVTRKYRYENNKKIYLD